MAKRKVKKRLIILLSLLTTFITAVVLFCAITGFNIKTFIFGTSATGNAVITETDLETFSQEPPSDGTNPSNYDALTNFSYFAYKLEHSNFEALTEGKASAKYNGMGVDQKVYDYRLKANDYILTDTRSTSTFVKVYQEQFYTSDKVLYRAGSSSNYDNMNVNARSYSQQFSLYGLGPEKIIGYIVCKETLLSDTGVISNGDGTFTTTYSLDPTIAPVYYQRKVKTNASISDMPNFVSVDLTYTYDSNWNIISATYNEVYSIYKMKSWIETSTNITETFTYLNEEDAYNKIKDKYDFYKNYFDLEVPADDEVIDDSYQMTALDYLGTMASLMNSDYINANVVLDVNDKSYDILAKINPKDYSTSILYDDINLIYKNNKVYIKSGSIGYYDINEILSLYNLSLGDAKSLDTADLISGIMSDINNGIVSHNGDYTYVDIVFNLFDYSIPTTFTFYTPNEDTIEFIELNAIYNYFGDEYKISFSLLDDLDLSFDTEGVEPFVYAFDLSLDFNAIYNKYSFDISADIYIDLLNKALDGTISINVSDNNITLNVIYKDDYLYVEALDKIYFKISKDDIINLIKSNDTSNINLSISYELIRSYIENIIINTTESLDISYSKSIDLNGITFDDINLSITPRASYKDVLLGNYEYIDYNEINTLVDSIIDKALNIKESNGISLKADFKYGDYKAIGDIYLDYKSLSLKACLNISSKDFSTDAVIYYVGDNIYLEYGELRVSLSKDSIKNLIPKDNGNKDISELLDILGGISYNSSLDILLNTSSYIGDNIECSILNDLSIIITSSNISAKIYDINSYNDEIIVDDSLYVDVEKYLTDGLNIYELIKNKSFTIEISNTVIEALGHEVVLSGDIYVNNKNLDGRINVNIDNKYDLDVELIILDNNLYLTMLGQTFVLDLNTIDSFIDEALLKINNMLNTSYDINSNNKIDINSLLDLVSSAVIGDDIKIDLESLLNKAIILTVVLNTTADDAAISFNMSNEVIASGDIIIENSPIRPITINKTNLFDSNDILRLLDYVSSLYKIKDHNVFSVAVNNLILSKADEGDYFDISGSVKLNLIDGIKDFDAIINLIIVEYRNGKKYGWHQVNLTIVSATTSNGNAMVYGTYGNKESDLSSVVKVYSTFDGVKALINSIMDLMQIDTFNNMLEDDSRQLILDQLINSITLSESDLAIILNQQALNKYLTNESLISLNITKSNDFISNIELANLYLTYTNERDYLKLKSLDLSLEDISSFDVQKPSDMSDYIDLTNMSYLFEALYQDAQLDYFEIDGTIKLVASVVFDFTIIIPINIKVHVTESGEPEILAKLEIPSVNILLVSVLTKKTLTIAYKDGYVYLNRVDKESGKLFSSDKKNYFVKITYQEFMSDFLNYLLGDYGCGMPSEIMNLITNSSSSKGTPNAADCVNSATIGEKSFSFNLNLGEIAQDSNIGDMNVVLSTEEITNKNGEVVDVLTTIDTFTLKMVSVITLSGSGLRLLNISNGVANAVDMSSLNSFVDNADAKYKLDTKYSGNNGSYSIVETISHTLTYNYNGSTSSATYYYMDEVNLPSQANINGTNYEVIGWYSDSSYQHEILSYNMPAYDKTLYAKIK